MRVQSAAAPLRWVRCCGAPQHEAQSGWTPTHRITGGLSFARTSLATTGRWSECAAPVKVVGVEPICCHLHAEAWAWVPFTLPSLTGELLQDGPLSHPRFSPSSFSN
eukprot:scaffold5591_cov122-Isochrysis_galbana.AAC.2